MKIAINANEANVKNPVGSNIFAREVLNACYRLDSRNEYCIYLKTPPLALLPKERSGWQYESFGPKPFWTQIALSLKTLSKPAEVLFSPGHYGAGISCIPQVISVMDLAFLKYPNEFRAKDLWQLRFWTKNSVMSSQKIIAISKNTKNDIRRYYHVPEEKVEVVYPGVQGEFLDPNPELSLRTNKKYQIKGDYILFIGTLQPRKNINNLIMGFKMLLSKYPHWQLIVVGKKGWLYESIFQTVRLNNLEDKVIFTGFVNEEEKNLLIRQAMMLVFPSLYEGFGFPILEAFRLGCPVVCSRNSSLAEVAGQAAIYIENERNPTSIAQAMIKMLQLTKAQRSNLIVLGKKQVSYFSWDKAGRQIISILENVKR
jgi:glycosyltransferase involved in cell wall biosynthesis